VSNEFILYSHVWDGKRGEYKGHPDMFFRMFYSKINKNKVRAVFSQGWYDRFSDSF
jgi:hypothetical protein